MENSQIQEDLEQLKDMITDVPCDFKQLDTEEDGTFEGYGSVFNNKDLGNDVIRKGAFANTLKYKKPKQVKLLYQHKTDEPIGVIDSLEEDNKGLYIKGRLAMGTQKGREVYELMKMGALDSMSIGYRLSPDDYKYDPKKKKRMINSVDLMEISLVTFPMNPKAKITKVKLAEMNVRELEEHLRDVGCESFAVAKHTAQVLYKSYRSDEQRDVVESMNQLINKIKT